MTIVVIQLNTIRFDSRETKKGSLSKELLSRHQFFLWNPQIRLETESEKKDYECKQTTFE